MQMSRMPASLVNLALAIRSQTMIARIAPIRTSSGVKYRRLWMLSRGGVSTALALPLRDGAVRSRSRRGGDLRLAGTVDEPVHLERALVDQVQERPRPEAEHEDQDRERRQREELPPVDLGELAAEGL